MKNYNIINGYMIKDLNNKEEILNVLINVMSAKGLTVEYLTLKQKTCKELIGKLENIDKNYNTIVYEYDLEHNLRIYKADFSNDKRILKFCGKTLIIESFESFKTNLQERKMEGNKIFEIEKRILNEIKD